MSDSIESSKAFLCPVCGGELTESGLCPRCLLAEAARPTAAPGTTRGTAPPSLEDVTAAFPKFELIELIGTGGMGSVWKARQPSLNRHVALKLLPASLAERDPAFAERFEREGQFLARLHHPNIVTVHDSGRAGAFFYLVMEFVDGVNLRQAMQASRFTSQQALAIVPKICDALQYAHEEGVLHRDIKPENILLDTKGRVKLADFGIAKVVSQSESAPGEVVMEKNAVSPDQSLTVGDATLGTPNYMAPEQIAKPADVDHRADIYSLGVVFYELLTGELPIGRFAPPSERSSADPRLDGIVKQALEKERARRQQSVAEVKTQVETVTNSALNPSAASERALPPWKMPQVAWREGGRAIQWPVVWNQLAFSFGVQAATVLLIWLLAGRLFPLGYSLLLVVVNTVLIGAVSMAHAWKNADPTRKPVYSTGLSLATLLAAVILAAASTAALFYVRSRPSPTASGAVPITATTPPLVTQGSVVRQRLALKADAKAREPFPGSKWSPIGPFDESTWAGNKVPTKSDASWTALSPGPGVKPGGVMLMAHAGLGDTFPVQDKEGRTLGEVFVAEATDELVQLEIRSQEGMRKIELRRDRAAPVQMAGSEYEVIYPTVEVDPKGIEDPSTNKAMIMITRRP